MKLSMKYEGDARTARVAASAALKVRGGQGQPVALFLNNKEDMTNLLLCPD